MCANSNIEVLVLRERCRVLAATSRKEELDRRKKANALAGSEWFIKPEDYRAADERAFDAIWTEIMRQKALICRNTA